MSFRRWRLAWSTNLQHRLVASVLLAGSATTVLTAWVSYTSARATLRMRLQERVEAIANRGVAEVDRWLHQQREVLSFLARRVEFAEAVRELRASPGSAGPLQRITRTLHDLRAGPLDVEELQLLAPEGARVLAATEPSSVGQYAADARYFLEGRTRTMTQAVYPSPSTGRPRLTIATPVGTAGDPGQGVLVAHLDLALMETLADGPRVGSLPVATYLVNRYREFVSAARFGRADFRRGAPSLAIDRGGAGSNGFAEYANYEGTPVIGAWRWIPSVELAVIVEVPTAIAFAPARQLLGIILSVSLTAILALAFVVNLIMRRATRPLRETAAAAERVAEGDFTPRAAVTSRDEVGRLAASFNRMTERLDSQYRTLVGQVDMTRQALRRAEESESLLQSIVDHASLLVAVIDLDDRILLANRRFRAMFAPETVEGTPLAEAFARLVSEHRAQPLADLVKDVRREATLSERELLLGSAEAHTWQVACFPLLGSAGTPWATALVGTDLTERARAEEERRQTDARVQQAHKLESLGVMAGGIAHDFNNILAAIMGNATLARGTPQLPPDVDEALTEIEVASRRASDLTRQMLAYAGRGSMQRATFDINHVLTDLARLVRASYPKRITLSLDLSPDALWIHADQGQISQVFLNLLTNAMEAIGESQGSVTVATQSVHTGAGIRGCRISVVDTGVGMDAETQRRIFEPFYTTKASGRGLGLSAVMGIVRSLEGTLDVKSAPGRGTSMELFLPCSDAPNEAGAGNGNGSRRTVEGTVLVVDDEAAVRSATARMLTRAGYAVIEAASGEEAVQRHAEGSTRFHAMIFDLTMPGMSGVQAMREIRRRDAAMPVILVSGYDASGELEALQERDVQFLQKPFEFRRLIDAVRMARSGASGN